MPGLMPSRCLLRRVVPSPGIGVHRKARCTLGSLEVLSFEMLFVQRHRSTFGVGLRPTGAAGNKEKVNGRNQRSLKRRTKACRILERVRGICRKLVNRQTFLIALRAIELVVRVAKLVNELFGDF